MNYIGVDIIEISRIEEALLRWGNRFLHRVYTSEELRLYQDATPSLAARFAGKEAVVKALAADEPGILITLWRFIRLENI